MAEKSFSKPTPILLADMLVLEEGWNGMGTGVSVADDDADEEGGIYTVGRCEEDDERILEKREEEGEGEEEVDDMSGVENEVGIFAAAEAIGGSFPRIKGGIILGESS